MRISDGIGQVKTWYFTTINIRSKSLINQSRGKVGEGERKGLLKKQGIHEKVEIYLIHALLIETHDGRMSEFVEDTPQDRKCNDCMWFKNFIYQFGIEDCLCDIFKNLKIKKKEKHIGKS